MTQLLFNLDALGERSRNLYLFARALMGLDYAFPVVAASASIHPACIP